jgi:hypothetical protein
MVVRKHLCNTKLRENNGGRAGEETKVLDQKPIYGKQAWHAGSTFNVIDKKFSNAKRTKVMEKCKRERELDTLNGSGWWSMILRSSMSERKE